MQTPIIAIAETGDTHVEAVQRELDVPLYLIDPSAVTDSLSYSFANGQAFVYHNGELLQGVQSVWMRKPRPINRDDIPVPATYKDSALGALTRHTSALRGQFRDALWVSDPAAIERASHKPGQLEVAASLGFNVPETLMTSNPQLAEDFVDRLGKCVVKPVAYQFQPGQMMFTSIITSEMKVDFKGVTVDPMIFQRYIEPAHELRVMVVGDDVFAVRVISGQEYGDAANVRDSRVGQVTGVLQVEPVEISSEMAGKCRALTKHYGLEGGTIDIILDDQSTPWFLEINPNGEWEGFARMAGLPVARAMGQLLLRGPQ